MSYPKKLSSSNKSSPNFKGSPKLPEAKRDKLLAILEREQLKGLLVNKFIGKYSKEKKVDQAYVNKHVTDFMKNEKMTEANLKKLEQKIRDGAGVKSQTAPSQHTSSPKNQAQSVSAVGEVQQNQQNHDDALSVASSQKPRSVYVQGDEDDEWATILRYDAELYKKEKTLEKVREQDLKKKIKEELDRQIQQKKAYQKGESDELKRYVNLVEGQMKDYDRREQKKEDEMHNKVMQEKHSRDKQLQEENNRRKYEKKRGRELDELLVQKIKDEINQENQALAQKRIQDRENFKRIIEENEEKKKRMMEEARIQREADIRAQEEYTRLIEKQEADRAAEVKAREDRAKKFMSMMADTVVKDQRAQILAEERKLLQHHMDKEARDAEEERRRQQRLKDQKNEVKNYLDLQMQEKEKRKQEEREVEKKQAEIWKKDTEDFNAFEKQKSEHVKDVNTHHAAFLKSQIEEEKKRQKKMNAQELLLNKPKLREIAEKDAIPFHKQLVNPHRY